MLGYDFTFTVIIGSAELVWDYTDEVGNLI
jgi:hypothetical protein